nr:MAG TPA: hypothetical protein [Caudoviricetes sp.]
MMNFNKQMTKLSLLMASIKNDNRVDVSTHHCFDIFKAYGFESCYLPYFIPDMKFGQKDVLILILSIYMDIVTLSMSFPTWLDDYKENIRLKKVFDVFSNLNASNIQEFHKMINYPNRVKLYDNTTMSRYINHILAKMSVLTTYIYIYKKDIMLELANVKIQSLQEDKQNLEADINKANVKIQSLERYSDRLKAVCHSSYVKNTPVWLTSETNEYIVRM